jgi:hypothetical protein
MDPADADTRLVAARDRYFVAERVDGKAEDVEADSHVTYRGRSKYSGFFGCRPPAPT